MRFARLAGYFEELEGTSSRKALVEILGRLFSEAPGPEIDRVVYLCQGRLVPFFIPIEIGMGEKLVETAIALAYGRERAEVHQEFERVGDLGEVAASLARSAAKTELSELTVTRAYDCFHEIATASGSGSVERRTNGLADLMRDAEPIAAKYLVRIPLGKLRLGVGDPTILEGLSVAKCGDKSLRKVLEPAYNRTSDLGLIATTLWSEGIEAVEQLPIRVGNPVRPALAERLPNAQAIIAKLGRAAAEPKWDGFRTQVHKKGDEVRIYSRNLEDMTGMFPELVQGALEQVSVANAIFEGEAVAYNPLTDEFLPFQQTTKRRRKHGIEEAAASLPLKLFVFDCLYTDGADITGLSYIQRRECFAEILKPGEIISLAPQVIVEDESRLLGYFNEMVGQGLEGLMVKKLDSPYQAGGRNFNWVKFKRSAATELQDTVDTVILGYIFGRGKRSAFGAGALLVGVYDPGRDEFVTVTKIGTGLSDLEWRQIRERCDKIVVPHRPARVSSVIEPSAWVEPEVVIEVLADEITRSPIHTCGKTDSEPGYALRFPRLVSFRDADKRPEDATTVTEIIEMYRLQSRRDAPIGETA